MKYNRKNLFVTAVTGGETLFTFNTGKHNARGSRFYIHKVFDQWSIILEEIAVKYLKKYFKSMGRVKYLAWKYRLEYLEENLLEDSEAIIKDPLDSSNYFFGDLPKISNPTFRDDGFFDHPLRPQGLGLSFGRKISYHLEFFTFLHRLNFCYLEDEGHHFETLSPYFKLKAETKRFPWFAHRDSKDITKSFSWYRPRPFWRKYVYYKGGKKKKGRIKTFPLKNHLFKNYGTFLRFHTFLKFYRWWLGRRKFSKNLFLLRTHPRTSTNLVKSFRDQIRWFSLRRDPYYNLRTPRAVKGRYGIVSVFHQGKKNAFHALFRNPKHKRKPSRLITYLINFKNKTRKFIPVPFLWRKSLNLFFKSRFPIITFLTCIQLFFLDYPFKKYRYFTKLDLKTFFYCSFFGNPRSLLNFFYSFGLKFLISSLIYRFRDLSNPLSPFLAFCSSKISDNYLLESFFFGSFFHCRAVVFFFKRIYFEFDFNLFLRNFTDCLTVRFSRYFFIYFYAITLFRYASFWFRPSYFEEWGILLQKLSAIRIFLSDYCDLFWLYCRTFNLFFGLNLRNFKRFAFSASRFLGVYYFWKHRALKLIAPQNRTIFTSQLKFPLKSWLLPLEARSIKKFPKFYFLPLLPIFYHAPAYHFVSFYGIQYERKVFLKNLYNLFQFSQRIPKLMLRKQALLRFFQLKPGYLRESLRRIKQRFKTLLAHSSTRAEKIKVRDDRKEQSKALWRKWSEFFSKYSSDYIDMHCKKSEPQPQEVDSLFHFRKSEHVVVNRIARKQALLCLSFYPDPYTCIGNFASYFNKFYVNPRFFDKHLAGRWSPQLLTFYLHWLKYKNFFTPFFKILNEITKEPIPTNFHYVGIEFRTPYNPRTRRFLWFFMKHLLSAFEVANFPIQVHTVSWIDMTPHGRSFKKKQKRK